MLLHIRCKVRFSSFRGCTFEVALAFLVVFNSLQTKHNFKIKKLLHQLILVSSVLYSSYLLYLYLTIFHKLKCVGNPNPKGSFGSLGSRKDPGPFPGPKNHGPNHPRTNFFSRLVTTHPGPIHGGARCCRPRPQRVGKGFPVSTLVKPPPPSRTRRRPLLPLPCARRLTHGCLLFFTLLFLAYGGSRTTTFSSSRRAPEPPPLPRARRPPLPHTEQHSSLLFLTHGGLLSSRAATSSSSRTAASSACARQLPLPRAQRSLHLVYCFSTM